MYYIALWDGLQSVDILNQFSPFISFSSNKPNKFSSFFSSLRISYGVCEQTRMCVLSELDMLTNKFVALEHENQRLLKDLQHVTAEKAQ